jgi:hypothetical protein
MRDETQVPAPDLKLTLARAFDAAWTRFIAIEGEAADTAENRGALAARIVVLARVGEENEARIVAAALTFLRALVAARRLGRTEGQDVPASAPAIGPVLDPDAIAAAVTAYDSCLEELPEGIPAAARSTLLRAILAKAGDGERDSDRLRLIALEALRLRT